jgi:glutathione S-transferase
MKPSLFAHPFSSYCQKVLIALYENGTAFIYRKIGPEDPDAMSELAALWPLKKFPVLLDEGQTYAESSVIIEHLGIRHPGAVQLIPNDPQDALKIRMMDRIFDNYVMRAERRDGKAGLGERRRL